MDGPLERRVSATVWQVGPKQSRMQLEDRSCWLLWDLEEREIGRASCRERV